MKRRLLMVILTALLLGQALGCAPAALPTPAPMPFGGEAEKVVEVPQVSDIAYGLGGVGMPPAEDRLIVRTGNISIVVEDTGETLVHLEALAKELEGYISDSRSWRVNERLHATITLRVPAEDFDEARSRIKEEALEVEGEDTSAQDVTEEYTDLEARLTNLRATEEELRELLSTVREKTQKAEDILAVYRELTSVRGQIEQIQGRMQYLEHAVAMATITVTLTPKEEIPLLEKGWSWVRIVRDSIHDLVVALQFLAELGTRLLITMLPILIIVALPFAVLGWLVWLWRRRRSKGKE